MDSDGAVILSILLSLVVFGGLVALLIYLARKSQQENTAIETQIVTVMSQIPPDKQMLFQMQFNNVRKSATTALLLNFFLGGVGGHRFYMGETGTGILYVLFCWTGIPAIIAFFELFVVSKRANEYNLKKAQELAYMMKSY